MTTESKICQNCKQSFVIEPDDFNFYEKVKVPPPTFCPDCRKQRRLTWRNDTSLYTRTCDLCKKSIVSIYPPNTPSNRLAHLKNFKKPLTVYCQKCWWGDSWDPKAYGRDYDFNRSFFEQFLELQQQVPVLTTVNDNDIASVNCEYTQDFAFGKNCYMVFIAWKLENCAYGYYMVNDKEVVDALSGMGECEFTYETIFTEKCYQCKYVYYSTALSDCNFCYDCRDCTDCFLCVGLRHKKYCFKNQQYSKEEYEKILSGYRLDTYSGVERAKKEFEPMLYRYPRRFSTMRNCVNCTGNDLINGKNSKFCFNVIRPEDCKWFENGDAPKDSYDLTIGGELNQCYEGITPDHSYRNLFSIFSWKNTETTYVDACHSSKYLFGCSGMKKGEYCILNKQYSKEEYEALTPKIRAHMDAMPFVDKLGNIYKFGEFFPSELSYFHYNESMAQDQFPLTREEAVAKKYAWQDDLQITVGKETLNTDKIPEAIADVSDSIREEILACLECKRNYRIVPVELTFYRRMNVPIPRRCFYCRHRARIQFRNPYKLWSRACQCAGGTSENGVYQNTVKHFHEEGRCPNTFETSYPPERPEIVYCEQCYQVEIA